MNCMEKYEVDIRHIPSHETDDANVNFGKHDSVYQLLSNANNHILNANCTAYRVHTPADVPVTSCQWILSHLF